MISIRVAVLAAAALAAGPALAAEEVLLLQTQETPDVAAPCPDQNIKLGAYVYAPRTRAMDGRVMKEFGRPVGTVVGCGNMTFPVKVGDTAPFNMSFDLGGRAIYAEGECKVKDAFKPEAGGPLPVLLVGCALEVKPDGDQGLMHGIATSASVFLLGPTPGYETGSFWTLHLFTLE